MNETFEWCKVIGVNSFAVGAVSMDALEQTLSILVLMATFTWTMIKIWKLLTNNDEEKD